MGIHWLSICFGGFVDMALPGLWVRFLKSSCPLLSDELTPEHRSSARACTGVPRPWAPSCDVRPGWEVGEKGKSPGPAPTPPLLFHPSRHWGTFVGMRRTFRSQCCLSSADGLKPLKAKSPPMGGVPELMEGRAKVGDNTR